MNAEQGTRNAEVRFCSSFNIPCSLFEIRYARPILFRCDACETMAWRIFLYSMYFIPYSSQVFLMILLMAG